MAWFMAIVLAAGVAVVLVTGPREAPTRLSTASGPEARSAGAWTSDSRADPGRRVEPERARARPPGGAARPLVCTREVGDVSVLRVALAAGRPEEVLCVRATRTQPAALVAVAFARKQLGQPYRWGGRGNTDGGFDCSGLTSSAYAASGLRIPRTAQAQFDAGPRLPPGQPIQPGDLVFFGAGPRSVVHVGLAVSATEMIHAPDEGDVVRRAPIKRRDFLGATRP